MHKIWIGQCVIHDNSSILSLIIEIFGTYIPEIQANNIFKDSGGGHVGYHGDSKLSKIYPNTKIAQKSLLDIISYWYCMANIATASLNSWYQVSGWYRYVP